MVKSALIIVYRAVNARRCVAMALLSAVVAVLMAYSTGCSVRPDQRLDEISAVASEQPYEALRLLDSIDYASLSTLDRHYFDLISIKAKDKAYITHTSDSLILQVINYAAHHRVDDFYAEALYYGGRVYSDLGDYPTSLRYFQNALDEKSTPSLRCKVLSQTGRLLATLCLYDEAIPYIEEAIEIDRNLTDTVSEVYDLQLLGGMHLRTHQFDAAERCFRSSIDKSSNLPTSFRAKSTMYLAAVKYHCNQLDSALTLIRHTPDLVSPIARNSALAYAAEIYQSAGIIDTAYFYAHELVNNDDFTNTVIGYQVLLSPELRNYIHPDTIDRYVTEYRSILVSYLNDNINQLAINQQSFYNYQLHERKRAKAEKSNDMLRSWLIIALLIVLLLIITALYLNNRNKKHVIELQVAIDNIGRLKQGLNRPSLPAANATLTSSGASATDTTALRNRLKDELLALYQSSNEQNASVPPTILQSNAYQELMERAHQGKNVEETDELWQRLETAVLISSPKFKVNLDLLTVGKLTSHDYHTSLLIKSGVPPTQMAVLLGRSKGAIVSRRETLCIKIFDKKLGTKVIDAIIRLL